MPELHPGPDVSLGQLEAQLHELGLAYNVGYFLTTVDGAWVLSVSDENYQRWQDAHGDTGQKGDKEPEEPDEDEDDEQDVKESTPDAKTTTSRKTTTSHKTTRRTTKNRGR